jgi:hypothetical protein
MLKICRSGPLCGILPFFAMAGDAARAASLAQDLNKRFPLDTQTQSLWLPGFEPNWHWTGRIRLAPSTVSKLLSPSSLGKSCSLPIFPAYLRRMFADRHTWQPDRAVLPLPNSKRFSITAGSSGTAGRGVGTSGRGSCQCVAGENRAGADADAARVRALAAYKDFLTLWKDADPDIPMLQQAKAEYAKLE